jgi:hypothetical protein
VPHLTRRLLGRGFRPWAARLYAPLLALACLATSQSCSMSMAPIPHSNLPVRCAAPSLLLCTEGRIDPSTRRLQCSYHGWQFDGAGRCTALPQADSERQLQAACGSRRACVASYPVTVQQVPTQPHLTPHTLHPHSTRADADAGTNTPACTSVGLRSQRVVQPQAVSRLFWALGTWSRVAEPPRPHSRCRHILHAACAVCTICMHTCIHHAAFWGAARAEGGQRNAILRLASTGSIQRQPSGRAERVPWCVSRPYTACRPVTARPRPHGPALHGYPAAHCHKSNTFQSGCMWGCRAAALRPTGPVCCFGCRACCGSGWTRPLRQRRRAPPGQWHCPQSYLMGLGCCWGNGEWDGRGMVAGWPQSCGLQGVYV